MASRVFWSIALVQIAEALDCLQRSDLTTTTWSDAASTTVSLGFSGSSGSYTVSETDSVLLGSVAATGSDLTCFTISASGDSVQFLGGSNCNSIGLWRSSGCVGNPTYTLVAQPSLPALSDEPSESASPTPFPGGDAVPSASDVPSPVPVSDVPSPTGPETSPATIPASPSPLDPRCKAVVEVIVPGPLNYIAGLPQNGLQTLASTVLGTGDGSCPSVTTGTETVHYVEVTPGLSWIVKLLKGYTLTVTGWGTTAKDMVGFLLDYTTNDDAFAALKVKKPAVPASYTIAFAVNLDRLDSVGQLLNDFPLTAEVDLDVPVVAIYIFHDGVTGKLLQNEEGYWTQTNGKVKLFLKHTSAIVAFANGAAPPAGANQNPSQSSNGGSSSGLYALLALLAIPALCICGVIAYIIYSKNMVAMEKSHLDYQYNYNTYNAYSCDPRMAPPPTPVQSATGSFIMV